MDETTRDVFPKSIANQTQVKDFYPPRSVYLMLAVDLAAILALLIWRCTPTLNNRINCSREKMSATTGPVLPVPPPPALLLSFAMSF
ncbi:hypothetical protein RRG08_020308 [Elysia crispata]|uniref:Uncharacterized protein n=1 Tax=Elysia crispata TaxID=231223 RepID=A0AAE1ADN5_9GAST|nr:hypothetical protein RRG08_020308 [Elysia crispata]